MDRPMTKVTRKRSFAAVVATGLALGLALAPSARGALPPHHGGRLTLPAPESVLEVDPARVSSHFEATLAEALFDGLYEVRGDGRVEPVLAEGPPQVEGTIARIRLRPGIRHHGGRALTARQVVRSILRVSSSPSASWLLGAIAVENGRPVVREVDERTLEIGLARRGLRIETVLAATPLAIVAGGNLRRAPIGTGAFRARLDGHGGLELAMFRFATDRAPWLNRVSFTAPRDRDEEVRAFELGRLDGSWWGRSVYGGEPVRPVTTTSTTAATPVLLIPNRARALRDDATWGGVVTSIDRRRLERVGLVPSRSLGEGLPAHELPRARAQRDLRLRMAVRASRSLETRIAEAVAGMLDERGVRLQVDRLSDDRYDAAIARGEWDLRLATVRPPLPGRGPLAAAALAAAGQTDRARQLAASLDDAEPAAQVARDLDVMILGHERIVLHHRADLVGARFDGLGRFALAHLSFARPVVEETR